MLHCPSWATVPGAATSMWPAPFPVTGPEAEQVGHLAGHLLPPTQASRLSAVHRAEACGGAGAGRGGDSSSSRSSPPVPANLGFLFPKAIALSWPCQPPFSAPFEFPFGRFCHFHLPVKHRGEPECVPTLRAGPSVSEAQTQVGGCTNNERGPPARLPGTCETPQRQTAPCFLPAQWLAKAALRFLDELFSCDTE